MNWFLQIILDELLRDFVRRISDFILKLVRRKLKLDL